MPATRSKSGANLRQSRIDFSKAVPATAQSSPLPNRTTRTQSRAQAAGAATNHKPTTRPNVQFLGASTRKKQTYLQHSSDDDSDVSLPPPTNPVDSENLMGTQWGNRAAFVFDETDSDDTAKSEDDNIPLITSSSRKRKRPTTFVVNDDDSDSNISEDDASESVQEVATPPKKVRKLDKRDEEDLADDLEFLRSSPPAITPKGAASKKDARSKALEDLKRKRQMRRPKNTSPQKKRRMVVLDSSDEASDDGANDDDQSHSKSDDEEDGSDDDLEEVDGQQIFEEQDDDEDFIADDDDDDEGALGIPPSSIPIGFTGWAKAKPKELFKFGVEWFVQKKINPAFNREDELYKLTWQKLNDEIIALVGSRFTSSAWNRDFTYSLQSRPVMVSTRVEAIMQDCEACNRTGHPATWRVQFTGNPYHDDTYEDVEQESDEEAEGITRDRHKRQIPPSSRTYSMGATCFKNAQKAHRLKHWRYSLGEWVMDYLADVGELEPAKIVARDGWKESRRRHHANAIVQRMEDEEEIQSLYRTMKAEVNTARGATDWG